MSDTAKRVGGFWAAAMDDVCGPAPSRWVLCRERLPREHKSYLCAAYIEKGSPYHEMYEWWPESEEWDSDPSETVYAWQELDELPGVP